MKWITSFLIGAISACGAGDDTVEGSRAECAFGAQDDCDAADRTATAACTRLVECAAIPLDRPENMGFDWAACVDRMSEYDEGSRRLVISCIATSTCDALQVPGSPISPDTSQMTCLRLGDR